MGILPAVSDAQTLILADKLVHASIIDGIRLSTARCIRFRHNDLVQLERLLEQHHATFRQLIIVTESIFSMDGDQADLTALVRLKKILQRTALCGRSPCIRRKGTARSGLRRRNRMHPGYRFPRGHLRQGSGVCRRIHRLLPDDTRVSRQPDANLIFTTALPPTSIAWTLFIVRKLARMQDHREHLARISRTLREALQAKGTDAPAQAISSH